MTTLKQAAESYETPQTKNIVDLDAVPLELDFKEETKINSSGEEYIIKYIGLNGEKYRVPNSVLEGMKTILDLKPECKVVKVTKKGDGLNTRYTVTPIE
tara:strand:+ start:283 stop:579 length:297 start_codon:yes stop_codon:yes gene_type:complete